MIIMPCLKRAIRATRAAFAVIAAGILVADGDDDAAATSSRGGGAEYISSNVVRGLEFGRRPIALRLLSNSVTLMPTRTFA